MNKPKIRFKGFEGEWKEIKLGEFFSVEIGEFVIKTKQKNNAPYPVYNGGVSNTGFYDCYNQEGPKIIVSARGANAGYVNYCTTDFWAGNSCYSIGAKNNDELKFFFYFLKRFQEIYMKNQYSASIPSISKQQILRTNLMYPSLPEQRALASYFTSLDAQIAASTSRLSSLKQIKAASLLNMFPQKGETVPRVRFKGFQGEWVRQRLGDISASFSGGTPAVSVSDYYGGNIPFIRSGEIHENRTQLYITQAGLNNSSAKIVEKGTILYALYGATSGDVGISKLRGAINQAILAIEPTKDIDNFFLAGFLQSYKNRIINELLQGGQGNLSGSLVKKILLAIPSLPEQRAIASYFTALDAQITLQRERLEKLKQIKAACLEKMFA